MSRYKTIRDRLIQWIIRDGLHDKFSRLDQGFMTLYEYQIRFHKLCRECIMILLTKQKRVYCCNTMYP